MQGKPKEMRLWIAEKEGKEKFRYRWATLCGFKETDLCFPKKSRTKYSMLPSKMVEVVQLPVSEPELTREEGLLLEKTPTVFLF